MCAARGLAECARFGSDGFGSWAGAVPVVVAGTWVSPAAIAEGAATAIAATTVARRAMDRRRVTEGHSGMAPGR